MNDNKLSHEGDKTLPFNLTLKLHAENNNTDFSTNATSKILIKKNNMFANVRNLTRKYKFFFAILLELHKNANVYEFVKKI